jgi:hypothetical protein
MYHICIRTYQHTALTVLNRDDIYYSGHKRDAGVGSGRQRQFLNTCGFLHNVMKRVRNRTARFRCVFGSTDDYGF